MVAQGSSADARVTRVASDLPAAGRKIALPRNQVFDLPHSARKSLRGLALSSMAQPPPLSFS